MMKKILIGVAAFIVLFIAVLVIVPIIFKDKLMAIAKQQIDDQLNAEVEWSDLGVSAFKAFPSISLYAKNLVVINEAPFKGDTLAKIAELVISLNPMKLLNGKHVEISG